MINRPCVSPARKRIMYYKFLLEIDFSDILFSKLGTLSDNLILHTPTKKDAIRKIRTTFSIEYCSKLLFTNLKMI